jgi:GTP cyclohydrolase I
MTRSNPELGAKIQELLGAYNLLGPLNSVPGTHEERLDVIKRAFLDILDVLGISSLHPSTVGTPERVAKLFTHEICKGIDWLSFPDTMVTPTEGQRLDEIVLIRDIEVHSLCEHHFVPIIGRAHIAYIPGEMMMGLSKFNRIVEFFSRRPQLQERLTAQISLTLQHLLKTYDVAVIIEADHLCVKYRGIQDPCSDTVTSSMCGKFRSEASARQELLALIALKGR